MIFSLFYRAETHVDVPIDALVTAFIAKVLPLDLIIFRDQTDADSFGTACTGVSHCMVAINAEWCGQADNNMLVWELSRDGIQTRRLDDIMHVYMANSQANIGLCTLADNPTTGHDLISEQKLRDRIASIEQCRIAGVDPMDLAMAIFPHLSGYFDIELFKKQNKWLFRSELACAIYEHCGIVTHEEVEINLDDAPINLTNVRTSSIFNMPPVWIRP